MDDRERRRLEGTVSELRREVSWLRAELREARDRLARWESDDPVDLFRPEHDRRQHGCCRRCRTDWEQDNAHLPFSVLMSDVMHVCPMCGDKRCRRANDHRMACTWQPAETISEEV